jgi:glycosyltransferase involved in cell wall biosynthesis
MYDRPDMAEPTRVLMLDLLSIVPYYTGHLCASLRGADGARVTLASITYQHDPEFFHRQGIHNDPGPLDVTYRLHRAPAAVRRLLKIGEYVVNMGALLARFAVSRPDLIHVQFLPLAAHGIPLEQWWLRLARAFGIRVVYTVHNVLPQDSGDRRAGAYRRIYRLADRLICHDAQAASRLAEQFGVAPERISIIPHGPLFEDIQSGPHTHVRERLGIASDETLVLWQGILRPYKGVSFLLKAWQHVCTRNARARLAVVGAGERDLVSELENEVRQLGIENRVRLEFRFVSVSELADFYEAADILVYPYKEVTTSGALMTGIVRGKAIVASVLPAFEQILRQGENALLVRYGDVEDLAAALLRLIGDAGLRRELGGRLAEAQFPQWEDIARRTCECYGAAVTVRTKRAAEPVSVSQ